MKCSVTKSHALPHSPMNNKAKEQADIRMSGVSHGGLEWQLIGFHVFSAYLEIFKKNVWQPFRGPVSCQSSILKSSRTPVEQTPSLTTLAEQSGCLLQKVMVFQCLACLSEAFCVVTLTRKRNTINKQLSQASSFLPHLFAYPWCFWSCSSHPSRNDLHIQTSHETERQVHSFLSNEMLCVTYLSLWVWDIRGGGGFFFFLDRVTVCISLHVHSVHIYIDLHVVLLRKIRKIYTGVCVLFKNKRPTQL